MFPRIYVAYIATIRQCRVLQFGGILLIEKGQSIVDCYYCKYLLTVVTVHQ